MVSKKNLKALDFNSIQEYYDYINDSVVNGQRQQAIELAKDLSNAQRRECIHYYHAIGRSLETNEACKIILSYVR